MARRLAVFLVLMSLHTSLLITSTIAGAKFIALPFGLSASATVISYLLTFIILNAIAELYGRQYSRFVINMGLVGMALSAAYFELAVLMPAANPEQEKAFQAVLGASWRIWLGGWTAYIVSQNLDLWSFLKLKPLVGRSLVIRAWISMLLGQLLDTIIFMTIAFYGISSLPSAIAGQYLIKLIFVTLAAPLVSAIVHVGRIFVRDVND